MIKLFGQTRLLTLVATLFVAAAFGNASAQKNPPQNLPKPADKVAEVDLPLERTGAPVEKSLATSEKVNVSVCVREGNLRINGWNRGEVRAFVTAGSNVGFAVMETDASKKPAWINVTGGVRTPKGAPAPSDNCLAGDDIVLDVPRGAVLKIKTGESDVRVSSVAKISIESLDGDIYLSDIPSGVDATTFRGDLTVERVGGNVSLGNTEGNIIAIDVAPAEVGDTFRARTNSGRIVLSGVSHRVVETNSSTGATNFEGDLMTGGQYRFTATNGSIVLKVPSASVCRVNALFGFGSFQSDIPLTAEVRKERSLTAQFGAGETACNVALTTVSGVVRVRKRQ